ncbi:PspC domain-containing protein [Paenibacillus alkaliterrae]
MRKLYRSSRDKKLFGLCGGLAEMLNVDATLLRILLIVVTIFTSGAVILIYIIAGLVVPKEPPLYSNFGPNGFGNGYGGGYNPGCGQQSQFGGPYKNAPQAPGAWGSAQPEAAHTTSTQFDSMMDDLEKKALRREIEELKAKIAKYEKGDL